jgi:hypothetical protein
MQASTSTKYRPVWSTCLGRGRRSMSLQPPNGQEHPLGADKIEAPVNATQRTGASFMPHGGRGGLARHSHDIDLPSRLATLSFGHVAGLIQHHGRGVFGQRVAPQTNCTGDLLPSRLLQHLALGISTFRSLSHNCIPMFPAFRERRNRQRIRNQNCPPAQCPVSPISYSWNLNFGSIRPFKPIWSC